MTACVCQTEGYIVVGIDKAACSALDARVVQFQCDIRDLADDGAEETGVAAKRGTSAPRALKALLASLQPAGTSTAPAGTQVALLVNTAAWQVRAARPPAAQRTQLRKLTADALCCQVVCPFAEMTLKAFDEVMSTNLTAPFMLTKLLLPMLKARICNVTVAAMRFH